MRQIYETTEDVQAAARLNKLQNMFPRYLSWNPTPVISLLSGFRSLPRIVCHRLPTFFAPTAAHIGGSCTTRLFPLCSQLFFPFCALRISTHNVPIELFPRCCCFRKHVTLLPHHTTFLGLARR